VLLRYCGGYLAYLLPADRDVKVWQMFSPPDLAFIWKRLVGLLALDRFFPDPFRLCTRDGQRLARTAAWIPSPRVPKRWVLAIALSDLSTPVLNMQAATLVGSDSVLFGLTLFTNLSWF